MKLLKFFAKSFILIILLLFLTISSIFIYLLKQRDLTNFANNTSKLFSDQIKFENLLVQVKDYKNLEVYLGNFVIASEEINVNLKDVKLEKNLTKIKLMLDSVTVESSNIIYNRIKEASKLVKRQNNNAAKSRQFKWSKIDQINLKKIYLKTSYNGIINDYYGSLKGAGSKNGEYLINLYMSQKTNIAYANLQVTDNNSDKPIVKGSFKNLPLNLISSFLGFKLYDPILYASGNIETNQQYLLHISDLKGKIYNPDKKFIRVNNAKGTVRLDSEKLNLDSFLINLENNFVLEPKMSFDFKNKTINLSLKADKITATQVHEFWPSIYLSGVKSWIKDNINYGFVNNLDLFINTSLDDKKKIVMDKFNLDFDLNEASLSYSPKLQPIKNLNAKVNINRDALNAKILEGNVYDALINGSEVGINFKKQELAIKGLINDGKINKLVDFIKDVGSFKKGSLLDGLEGMIKGNFGFNIPITFSSSLHDKIYLDLELDKVSGKLPYNKITFNNANASVKYTKGQLESVGMFHINNDVSNFILKANETSEAKFKTNLEINSVLNAENTKNYLPKKVNFLTKGKALAKISYVTNQNEEYVEIFLEQGDGETIFRLPFVGFRSKKNDNLKFYSKLDVSNNNLIIKELSAEGKDILLKPKIDYDIINNFGKLVIEKGKWYNNLFNLNFNNHEKQVDLTLTSNFLDLSKMDFSSLSKKSKEEPNLEEVKSKLEKDYKIFVNVKKLILMKNHPINDLDIYSKLVKGKLSEIYIEGKLASLKNFNISSKNTENNDLYVKAETEDAGALLKAFNLYKKMNKGKLYFEGTIPDSYPKEKAKGKLEIKSVFLEEDSILMQLIHLSSPTNFLYRLANKGTFYSSISSELGYQNKVLNISNFNAMSDALDVKLNGDIDLNVKQINLKGKVIPGLFIMNTITKNIPVLGKLFSTAKEALISADFTIKGDSNKPKISINPLSLFTPDIVEKILDLNKSESKDKEQ